MFTKPPTIKPAQPTPLELAHVHAIAAAGMLGRMAAEARAFTPDDSLPPSPEPPPPPAAQPLEPPPPVEEELDDALEAVCVLVVAGARLAAELELSILEETARHDLRLPVDGQANAEGCFVALDRWKAAHESSVEYGVLGTLGLALEPLRPRRKPPAQHAAGQAGDAAPYGERAA